MFVIAGVTGNTGSVAASALLERGRKVRVIVRDAAKGEAWKARGAEVAVLDLEDEAALTKALEGATGAYLLAPPDLGATGLIAKKRKLVDGFARAVDASGVRHVVFLSSVGAQHDTGTGPIQIVAYGERQLAKTKAKTTFVRAAYFLENWGPVLGAAAGGKLPTFLPPDLAIPMVATKDIGLTVARALVEGPSTGTGPDVIELAGPADYSSRDVAKALSGILGKPVEVEAAPLEAVVPVFTSFGIGAEAAGLFREMYAAIASGRVAWEGKGARLVRGSVDLEAALRGLGAG